MRWPFASKTEVVQPPAIEPGWSDPVPRQSPGLQTILERLREDRLYRVLDLGPAIGSNISYFTEFADHIRVVDLLAEGSPVLEAAELDEEEEVERVVGTAFPEDWGPFDLVFAWDLLNYLEEATAHAVVQRLRLLCNTDASLFLMVVSAEEMAESPLQYWIRDSGTLEYRASSPRSLQAPGWPPSTVERMCRGFRIERSFVLRHGVQEYVAIKE
jgi:hypothetical protein